MQQVLAAALRAAEILPVEGPNSNPDAVTWALKLFLQDCFTSFAVLACAALPFKMLNCAFSLPLLPLFCLYG